MPTTIGTAGHKPACACGHLDDPAALYTTRLCLEPVSKNLQGELKLMHRERQQCEVPACTTLKTDHVLRLDVSSNDPCDSALGKTLDGVLGVRRLVHALNNGTGEGRGIHTGEFTWIGDGVVVQGELSGMTNVGTHRPPPFDPCQTCHDPGWMEGRLCGRIVRAEREELIGCRVTAAYRIQFDASEGFQDTGVRGTLEGVVVCTCGKQDCLDFTTFPEATHPNPWVVQGTQFHVFDFSASPVANTRIQTWSGFTGLDVSFTTLVRLPAPASSVSITMVHFATAPTVVALDAANNVVDAASMTVANVAETLSLSGPGIVALKISAPQDESLILELCLQP